jgi:myo-inositol 2-dehydrogenase/D-chiro-inositol 1-dehydrogenase
MSRGLIRTRHGILPAVNETVLDLALVGAGRMGRTHLRALARSRTVRVRDVVDPVPAVRAELSAAGFRVHASLAELLVVGAPDAVLVAAPTNRHDAVVRGVVAAGLPVLCEKPGGLTSSEVADVGRAAADAGVAFQVAYWRRFVPAMVRLRERVVAGELGQVLHVHCAQWDGAPPPAAFRIASGGIFADMGVHEFDVVRWLTGAEITGVRAVATPAVDNAARPDVDNAQVLFTLTGGATATASLGRHYPDGDIVTLEVFGTTGHERLVVLDPADGERAILEALVAQAESFARLVAGGPREGAGVDDAVAALDAAERAAHDLARLRN